MRVSGTIKKSEEEAIRRARLHIRRAQRASISARVAAVGDGGNVHGGEAATNVEDYENDMGMFHGIEDREEIGGAEECDEDED